MILKIKVLLCKYCSCVFNFSLNTNNIVFLLIKMKNNEKYLK